MKSERLNLYLGDLKEPFLNHCKQLNLKPGQLIKQAITQIITQQTPRQTNHYQLTNQIDTGKKRRVGIYLTENEQQAIAETANAEGTSSSAWMVRIIRAALTNMPPLSKTEAAQLSKSNFELHKIGVNLNQVAKHLNAGLDDPAARQTIEQLKEHIETHTAKVNIAVQANFRKWRLD